jgi:hypothetical protein
MFVISIPHNTGQFQGFPRNRKTFPVNREPAEKIPPAYGKKKKFFSFLPAKKISRNLIASAARHPTAISCVANGNQILQFVVPAVLPECLKFIHFFVDFLLLNAFLGYNLYGFA